MISTEDRETRVHIANRPTRAPADEPAGRLAETIAELLPGLVRWCRGRLPQYARRRADTEDLVQDAALGALVHKEELQSRSTHSVHCYLRNSILNRIRDEVRRSVLGEVQTNAQDVRPDPGKCPETRVVEREERRQYWAALEALSLEDQVLIVGRVDLHLSYSDLADALGAPSADAARAAARRAILRLGREIETLRSSPSHAALRPTQVVPDFDTH